ALMRLRLTRGIPLSTIALAVDPVALAEMVDEGFLIQTNGRLAATPAGRLVLNSLLGRLLV
ncbi:MAG: coproporphyrinogen III oxidase, partial [Alphaproteobacteria bacterium]|nr:coproporphyrinogen III oxidase [Alphaproteobacteria bacterium]